MAPIVILSLHKVAKLIILMIQVLALTNTLKELLSYSTKMFYRLKFSEL